MALTELQVENIKSLMTSDEAVLLSKFKARDNGYETITVLHPEVEGWEKQGYVEFTRTKLKSKMRREKEVGRRFEDDVWCMFYKLGFRTLNKDENLEIQWGPNESDTQQLDVVAVGDDAIFVVECKASEEWKPRTFKKELNCIELYKEGVASALRQIYGQEKRVKFIFATRQIRVEEESEDVTRMKNSGIFYFNDNTYDYITNLIKSYKEAVIYQFYGLMFKDEVINEDRIEIPALKGEMGEKEYYLFSIEPSTLLKIGFVLHRTRVNDSMAPTYQRLLVPKRLKGITDFINNKGFFPNSIIINFNEANEKLQTKFDTMGELPDSQTSLGVLSIPNAYGIAYLIDGQHRVYGYANSDYKDSCTIPVVAFKNLESEEQLRIFMEINENQKAVSPSLRLDLEEDLYWSSGYLDSRMKALRSSIIKYLAGSPNYILYKKIAIGEDQGALPFKPFSTALSKSELIPKAKKTKWDGDNSCCIYDINETNADRAMKDSRKRIVQFVNGAYSVVDELLSEERKSEYIFSSRGVYAFITLIGSLHRHLHAIGKINSSTPIEVRLKELRPYLETLSASLENISDEDAALLKGFLGQGADTFWLRMFQNFINKQFPDYEPSELEEWRETQDEELQSQGQQLKKDIRGYLLKSVFEMLKIVYGEKWENSIAKLRNDCLGKIYKEVGEENIDQIDQYDWTDYIEISEFKEIIRKNFGDDHFANAFTIDLGDGCKKTSEKIKWMDYITIPKGTKKDALNRREIDRLSLIYNHLRDICAE